MKCGIPEEWLRPFSDALALYFYIIAETGILASRTRMSLHRDGKFLRMLPPISVPVICLCCAAVEAAVLLSCLAGALMVIHNLLYFSDHLLFFLGHFLFLFSNLNHMSFIVVAHL